MRNFIIGFTIASMLAVALPALAQMGMIGYMQGASAAGKASRLEVRIAELERRVERLEAACKP